MSIHKKESLTGKNILIISPESWNHIFVSKHHYAIELSRRDNKVYFLNPPEKTERPIVVNATEYANLFSINYRIFFKGLRFLPAILRQKLERNFIENLETLTGAKFDVIWNFENSRFYDLDFPGPGVLKIYHQVDHNQDFHHRRAAETADIVFAVNTPIYELLKGYNKNTFRLPHAYQGQLSSQAKAALEGTYTYHKGDTIKAYYIGNLDFYVIDKDLVERTVAAHPGVEFYFVGPYNKDGETYRRLHHYPNAHFKGRVTSVEIPRLLADADLLFFAYDPKLISSSHKILEYFGSGKAIVSTYMEEFEGEKELLCMAGTTESYLSQFRKVVENIEYFNRPELMKARIRFAMDHSYPIQLDTIESLVRQHVVPLFNQASLIK